MKNIEYICTICNKIVRADTSNIPECCGKQMID